MFIQDIILILLVNHWEGSINLKESFQHVIGTLLKSSLMPISMSYIEILTLYPPYVRISHIILEWVDLFAIPFFIIK